MADEVPEGAKMDTVTPAEASTHAIEKAQRKGYQQAVEDIQARAAQPPRNRIVHTSIFGSRETASGNAPTFAQRRLAMREAKLERKDARLANKLARKQQKFNQKIEKFNLKTAKQQASQAKMMSKEAKLTFKNNKLAAKLQAIQLKASIRSAKAEAKEAEKIRSESEKEVREAARQQRRATKGPGLFARLLRPVRGSWRKTKNGPKFVPPHRSRYRVRLKGT